MDLYRNNQSIDSAVVGGASLDTGINQLTESDFINADIIGYPIDKESKNHFYSKLATIPEDAQPQVIRNYILIATSPPDPNIRLTPLALANLSMIKAEKRYNKREWKQAQNHGVSCIKKSDADNQSENTPLNHTGQRL